MLHGSGWPVELPDSQDTELPTSVSLSALLTSVDSPFRVTVATVPVSYRYRHSVGDLPGHRKEPQGVDTARHSNHSRYFMRAVGAAGIALVLGAFAVAMGVTAPASAAGRGADAKNALAPPCAPSAVREVTSTNGRYYGPKSIVKMTSSVRNTSKATCSVSVGPTSPSFAVTNSKGVECGTTATPATGPERAPVPHRRSLKPGATFSKTVAWDQRSGSPPARVPAGIYKVTTHFTGIPGNHSAWFKLMAR